MQDDCKSLDQYQARERHRGERDALLTLVGAREGAVVGETVGAKLGCGEGPGVGVGAGVAPGVGAGEGASVPGLEPTASYMVHVGSYTRVQVLQLERGGQGEAMNR